MQVGAWWLGFLILGPLMMLMAPVLCLFPKEMTNHRNRDASKDTSPYEDRSRNLSPSKIPSDPRLYRRICQAILGEE